MPAVAITTREGILDRFCGCGCGHRLLYWYVQLALHGPGEGEMHMPMKQPVITPRCAPQILALYCYHKPYLPSYSVHTCLCTRSHCLWSPVCMQ